MAPADETKPDTRSAELLAQMSDKARSYGHAQALLDERRRAGDPDVGEAVAEKAAAHTAFRHARSLLSTRYDVTPCFVERVARKAIEEGRKEGEASGRGA